MLSVGNWGVGLATRKADLNKVPLGTDEHSWVLRCDGTIFHVNMCMFKCAPTQQAIQEGDVIVSCSYCASGTSGADVRGSIDCLSCYGSRLQVPVKLVCAFRFHRTRLATTTGTHYYSFIHFS